MLAIEYELRSEKFRANLGASGPKRHLGTYTAPAGEDAIQAILFPRPPFSRRRGRRRTRSHCGDAHFSNNSGTCAPHVPSDSVAPIRNKTRANRTNLLLHKSNIDTSCKRGNPRMRPLRCWLNVVRIPHHIRERSWEPDLCGPGRSRPAFGSPSPSGESKNEVITECLSS